MDTKIKSHAGMSLCGTITLVIIIDKASAISNFLFKYGNIFKLFVAYFFRIYNI